MDTLVANIIKKKRKETWTYKIKNDSENTFWNYKNLKTFLRDDFIQLFVNKFET